MDSCPACRAFLQPDWDRCRICGHTPGEPVAADEEATGGRRGRRARKSAGRADRSARSATTTSSEPARRAAAVPTATIPRPPAASTTTGLPPLFADELAPPTLSTGAPRRPRVVPWVLGALVVIGAVVVGVLLLGGGEGEDPYADRPAAESADTETDVTQVAWTRFPVGPASVELPAPPFVEERDEQILVIGQLSMTTAEAVSGGLTYTVAVGALPEGVRQRDPDDMLQQVVDRWATAEAGRVVASEQVTVDGAPALRAGISGLERDLHVVAIVDGDLIVELRVAGQEPDPAAIQRLIDSFET